MGAIKHLGTISLIIIFVVDVFFDISCGVELILNDHTFWGCLTLVLVLTPGLVAVLGEVYKCCLYEGCCGRNATDWIYLLIYPLFTIVMMALGSIHQPCEREAMYLRSLEGFLTAAGQLILQLVVLGRGVLIHSLASLVNHLITGNQEHPGQHFLADKPLRWYWGLIQLYTIISSFISLLQTAVHFNEWEKKRPSLWRLLITIPYFSSTIVYRVTAIALLSLFFYQYVLIPVGIILVFNIVSFKILGLDLPRSIVYGVCSITLPAGYNRCKAPKLQPLGYSCDEVRYQTERSPEQLDILKERSKRFLALHLIFGALVFGISLALLWVMLNFSQLYIDEDGGIQKTTIIPLEIINGYIFPGILAAFLSSTIFTGVYCCTILCCFEEEYIYPLTIH